jgi:hypothetical protein
VLTVVLWSVWKNFSAAAAMTANTPIGTQLRLLPTVNYDNADRIGAAIRSRTPLDLPKNGRVACLHAKTAQQPFPDAAAGGLTEEPRKLADAAPSPGKGGSSHHFLDEGFLPAFLVAILSVDFQEALAEVQSDDVSHET